MTAAIVVERCCNGQCGLWLTHKETWHPTEYHYRVTATAALKAAWKSWGGGCPALIYIHRPVRP